jgi:hypothetical protein
MSFHGGLDKNMWRTSEGERVLRGAEWDLFRKGLAGIWGNIEDFQEDEGDSFHFGIKAFDILQTNQKLALLALVGKALRDEAVPMPKLTAHAEATVAAVFEFIRQSNELEMFEIEMFDEEGASDATSWRQYVLAACREVLEQWDEPLPEPSCDDPSKWDELIQILLERILWDYDFMEDSLLDLDSTSSKEKLAQMRIARDYYLEPAPDPTDKDMKHIRDTLREITCRS